MRKFLFIGDSLTYGYDVPSGLGWVELLNKFWQQNGLDIEVTNAGVNGDTLQGIYNRLEQMEINQYSYIFFMGGSNDILMGRDAESCFQKVKNLCKYIKEQSTAKVYVGIPMESIVDDGLYNITIKSYRQMILTQLPYLSLGIEKNCILDFFKLLHDVLLTKDIVYAGDVHPNEKGYRIMAKYALKSIELFPKKQGK